MDKKTEKIIIYRYKCLHCGEWAFYKPRTSPKLYEKGIDGINGPKTRHKGMQVDLLNVPHSPKFPFE